MEAVKKEIASLVETRNALVEIIDESFYRDLFKYGIYRLMARFNIKYDLERGFRGVMIEDLISSLISSFTEGNRKWNKTLFKNFKDQFLSAFDSHLSNTLKKELGKVIETITLIDDVQQSEMPSEPTQLLDEVLEILDVQLKCSPDEILIFEPYYLGKMKREDIAEALNITVQEVTNAKKRLDRKLPQLRLELKKRGYEE